MQDEVCRVLDVVTCACTWRVCGGGRAWMSSKKASISKELRRMCFRRPRRRYVAKLALGVRRESRCTLSYPRRAMCTAGHSAL